MSKIKNIISEGFEYPDRDRDASRFAPRISKLTAAAGDCFHEDKDLNLIEGMVITPKKDLLLKKNEKVIQKILIGDTIKIIEVNFLYVTCECNGKKFKVEKKKFMKTFGGFGENT